MVEFEQYAILCDLRFRMHNNNIVTRKSKMFLNENFSPIHFSSQMIGKEQITVFKNQTCP